MSADLEHFGQVNDILLSPLRYCLGTGVQMSSNSRQNRQNPRIAASVARVS